MDLSISIVTYKAKEYVDKFIESIYKNTKRIAYEILLVDNGSHDGTVELIREKYPAVKIISNKSSLYFVKGTNQNLKRAQGRYSIIFTPDTIVLPETLDKMVEFMDQNVHIGALTCKIKYPSGKLQSSVGFFPTIKWGFLHFSLLSRIFYAINRKHYERIKYDPDRCQAGELLYGACILVKKSVFDKIGFFDENITMFWEEYDLCKRISDAGWKLVYFPEAEIIHYRGESRKKDNAEGMRKISQKSILYIYKKYYGKKIYYLFKLLNSITELIRRPVIWLKKKKI